MQKYLVSQLKRGYLLYGRYFSKPLSLSRFKRVLSLLWFSAVPLPLGTPEHPILPVTHTKYPLASSLRPLLSSSCSGSSVKGSFLHRIPHTCKPFSRLPHSWSTAPVLWPGMQSCGCRGPGLTVLPCGVQHPAVLRASTGSRVCMLGTDIVLSVLCQMLLTQFRLGSGSVWLEMNLCKHTGLLYETLQLHFNITLQSGCE